MDPGVPGTATSTRPDREGTEQLDRMEDPVDPQTDDPDRTDPDRTDPEPLERHPDDGQLPSDTDVQAERQEEGVEAEVEEELVEAERRRRAEELPPEERSGGSDV